MRLLITTPIFPPVIGGPATYVYELCEYFKKNHDITVITFGDNLKKIEGVRMIPIRMKYNILGTFFRQFSLLRAINHYIKTSDLIYAQGPYVVGLMSYIASKLHKKPLIVKFVGDLVWETAFGNGQTTLMLDNFLADTNKSLAMKLKIRLQKMVFRSARHIIVPSEYLKNVLATHYKIEKQKIKVIYNGIKISGVRSQEFKIQNLKFKIQNEKSDIRKKYIITTIGRLVNWKQIDKIISALVQISYKLNVQLKIIGDGPERENLQNQAKILKIDKNIKFLGRLKHAETLKILSKADLFILYSLYEGLPHTIIEAMMLKIPVIASNISGTTEIAINKKTAILVDKSNTSDLADKIRVVLKNKELSMRLSKKAFEFVADKFNFYKNMKILDNLLESNIKR